MNQNNRLKQAESFYFSAVSVFNSNRINEAIKILLKIIRIFPEYPDSYSLLGLCFHKTGKLFDAEKCLKKAISLYPAKAEYYINLGFVQQDSGNNDSAFKSFKKAIDLEPDNPYFYNGMGIFLQSCGKFSDAIENFNTAILKSNVPDFYFNLAKVYEITNNFELAEKNYEEAVRLNPDNPKYYSSLGKVFNKKEDYESAVFNFGRAIELEPLNFQHYNHMGIAFINSNNFEKALPFLKKATELRPDLGDIYINCGVALEGLNEFSEAIENYFKAISLNPGKAPYYSNLAGCYEETGNYREAFKYYEKALELTPYDSNINYNISLLYLLHGDLKTGWKKYAYIGENKTSTELFKNNLKKTEWDGSDLTGKTIYVYSEQGFGDNIQFFRFLPEVHSKGGKVIYNCEPQLKRLLQNSKGFDIIISEPVDKISLEYDVFISVMSLPAVLEISLENIKPEIPYVFVPQDLTLKWKEIIHNIKGFKVGICWKPNPTHNTVHKRSFPINYLYDLGKIPNISLINLQKDGSNEKLKILPSEVKIYDFFEKIQDFADTAALINNLDLVISIDTVIAHLAGSLGKKVWTMLPFSPDWRWFLERSDSPWYPTMTLFRQKSPGKWETVYESIKSELEKIVLG